MSTEPATRDQSLRLWMGAARGIAKCAPISFVTLCIDACLPNSEALTIRIITARIRNVQICPCKLTRNAMTQDFNYDPVTVTDEATATGITADIFMDIRQTMNIPVVTSIWRALASWDNCLEQTWNAVKPIYLTRLPDTVLPELLRQTALSVPKFSLDNHSSSPKLNINDFGNIKSIVAAYNRSNGLNLIALAAFLTPTTEGDPISVTQSSEPSSTSPSALKALLSRIQIDDQTWDLVRQVNTLGTNSSAENIVYQGHVATLWRHLAHWPSFLSAVDRGFSPQQKAGIIHSMSLRTTALAIEMGIQIARYFKPTEISLPAKVLQVMHNYVNSPKQVARMVVIGHGISNWLEQSNHQ